LLQKHMLLELAYQLGPALEPMLAHAHHAGLGNGRLGQRRQHGGRHARRSAIALRAVRVIEVDGMTALGQGQRQQTAHEAAAENGDL
jgi:hypothetical protein